LRVGRDGDHGLHAVLPLLAEAPEFVLVDAAFKAGDAFEQPAVSGRRGRALVEEGLRRIACQRFEAREEFAVDPRVDTINVGEEDVVNVPQQVVGRGRRRAQLGEQVEEAGFAPGAWRTAR
jgi:hypothetical protein